jgi:hypothetical protein
MSGTWPAVPMFDAVDDKKETINDLAMMGDSIKTMRGWSEAKCDLDKYLQIGDAVDLEMADYFLCVLPPATYRANLIQIGEPYSHVNGRATFSTIYKPLGSANWRYAGHCHRGEWSQPTPVL